MTRPIKRPFRKTETCGGCFAIAWLSALHLVVNRSKLRAVERDSPVGQRYGLAGAAAVVVQDVNRGSAVAVELDRCRDRLNQDWRRALVKQQPGVAEEFGASVAAAGDGDHQQAVGRGEVCVTAAKTGQVTPAAACWLLGVSWGRGIQHRRFDGRIVENRTA